MQNLLEILVTIVFRSSNVWQPMSLQALSDVTITSALYWYKVVRALCSTKAAFCNPGRTVVEKRLFFWHLMHMQLWYLYQFCHQHFRTCCMLTAPLGSDMNLFARWCHLQHIRSRRVHLLCKISFLSLSIQHNNKLMSSFPRLWSSQTFGNTKVICQILCDNIWD